MDLRVTAKVAAGEKSERQRILETNLPEKVVSRIKGRSRVAVRSVGDLCVYMGLIEPLCITYRHYKGKGISISPIKLRRIPARLKSTLFLKSRSQMGNLRIVKYFLSSACRMAANLENGSEIWDIYRS